MPKGHPCRPPTGAFGPRLLATIALLTGRYRLGKRPVQAVLADLMGLSISTGMVSKAERRATSATATPVAEVAAAIASSPALNVMRPVGVWRRSGLGCGQPWRRR